MKLFNFFKNKEDNEELKKFKEYQKSFDSGEQRWGCDYEMIPTSKPKNNLRVMIYEINEHAGELYTENKILDKVYTIEDDEYQLYNCYHRIHELFVINEESYLLINEFIQNKSVNSTTAHVFLVISLNNINCLRHQIEKDIKLGMQKDIGYFGS